MLAAVACAAGCARPPGAAPTDTAASAPVPAASAPVAAMCPRVERAPRMSTGYAGWARDIPPEDMALAIDVLVPIQERLGNLFCAPELADCRPSALLGVELEDNRPSAAMLRLQGIARAPERELGLRLTYSEAAQWQPDAASLGAYLAACRGAAAAE